MGKRSRKRGSDTAAATAARSEHAPAAPAPGPDPVGRRARPKPLLSDPADRPPAPWGSFPLVEVFVLIALGMFIAGFVTKGAPLIVGGLAVGSIGGLELSIREHFAGFRSHSSLLALLPSGIAAAVIFLLTHGGGRAAILPTIAVIWLASFWLLRRAFQRKTGGLGFRR